jgi:hypothetical protein
LAAYKPFSSCMSPLHKIMLPLPLSFICIATFSAGKLCSFSTWKEFYVKCSLAHRFFCFTYMLYDVLSSYFLSLHVVLQRRSMLVVSIAVVGVAVLDDANVSFGWTRIPYTARHDGKVEKIEFDWRKTAGREIVMQ